MTELNYLSLSVVLSVVLRDKVRSSQVGSEVKFFEGPPSVLVWESDRNDFLLL